MKDNNNIDDIFRSGLEDYEMKPSEKSWNSLADDLAAKRAARRRNNGLKLFSVSLLLLILSYTAYRFYSTDKSPKSENQIKLESTGNHKISTVSSTPVQTIQPSSPVKIENNSSSLINNTITPVAETKSSTQQVNVSPEKVAGAEILNSESASAVPAATENKNAGVEKENKTADNKNTGSANTSKAKVNTSHPIAKATVGSAAVVSSAAHNARNVSDKNVNNSSGKEIFSKQTGNPETVSDNEQKTSAEINKKETAPVEEEIAVNTPANNAGESTGQKENVLLAAPVLNEKDNTIPAQTTGESNLPNPETSAAPLNNVPGPDAFLIPDSTKSINKANIDYTSKQKPDSVSLMKKIVSHLTAEIFYSPDYVNSKLKPNTDYTGTASQKLSDYDNQKAAFSYSTGINIRYDIGSKWSVGSGFFYSTFAQTAVYNTIDVVSDSVYQDEHGHDEDHGGGGGGHNHGHGGGHGGSNPHHPPGNNEHHYVIHTGCGAIDLYNEPPHEGNHDDGDTISIKTETSELIQFYNIPLMVRYQFGHHKFTYFIEGGAAVSFVHGDQVKIVVNDAYTENNEHDGLKNMNYSLLFGAGVQYNFYKGLNVFLKPSFRYSITPINQDNPMSSYPYYLGLGAGLSIHF